MFGVPDKLLGQGVLGIKVKIGEQALARPRIDVADRAHAILIIARRARIALGMVHVNLGVLVKPSGLGERLGQIAAPVARLKSEDLHPANHAFFPIDAYPHAARIAIFLKPFGHRWSFRL